MLRESPITVSECGQRDRVDLRLATAVQFGFLAAKLTRKFVELVQDHIEFPGHFGSAMR